MKNLDRMRFSDEEKLTLTIDVIKITQGQCMGSLIPILTSTTFMCTCEKKSCRVDGQSLQHKARDTHNNRQWQEEHNRVPGSIIEVDKP